MDIDLLLSSGVACFVASCVQTPQLFARTFSLVLLVISVFYVRLVLVRNKKHAIPARKCLLSGKYPPTNLPATNSPVTTQKVDSLITEVISLSLRDFVFSWFSPPMVTKTQKVSDIATSLSWQIVYLTQRKLNEVDFTTLLSQDVMIKLNSHFKTIRETGSLLSDQQFKFKEYIDQSEVEPCCLEGSCCHGNEEKKFLKSAAVVILQATTPPSIWLSPLLTELMGDVLSNYVLYPLIVKVTDSYYLYSCILPYIASMGSPMKDRKFFTQAKTYEDFIKKINKEADLSKLRQLRYKVIAEIMQAMTVENLKQEQDFDGLLSQINSKSYRLSTRNLARYINQCKVAKVTCEKRIYDITCLQKRTPHYADMRFREAETKLLELDEIMYSPYVLPFFVQFLEKQKDYGPLKLWLLIEQCRTLEKRPEELYPLIKQGYLDHLTVTSPLRAHQVSRHLIRMAEAYVEHKSGYWQFIYEIQEEIYTMISEQHYKPFLISSQYMQYVCTTEGRRGVLQTDSGSASSSRDRAESVGSDSLSDDFSKINSLKEELKSKEVLLETLDIMNYCSAEELSQLQEEIQNLRVTINQLEHHSERMTLWWQFLGEWEASVENVEASQTSEPLYTVIVRQKKHICQQILPFSNKSKFKLTQFNLNSTPQQSASLICICAKRRRRSRRAGSQNSPTKSGSSGTQTVIPEDDQHDDSTHNRDSSVSKITRTESRSSYESLMIESSYRSLRPHSILLSNTSAADSVSINSNNADTTSEDTISRNSVSGDNVSINSLMFTPDPQDTNVAAIMRVTSSGSESIQEEPSTTPTMLSHPLEVGNSLFYRNSSMSSSSPEPSSLTEESGSLSVDGMSLASESTLSGTIISELEQLASEQEGITNESETFSINEETPRLSASEYLPTLDADLSTLSLRESPPPMESDDDTISVTSQDFPTDFMFDDIFCGDNRSTRTNSKVSASEIALLEDTPSTKVRRYLSIYTDDDIPPLLDSNQSDDEKLRNLSRCGSAMSNTTSISIDEEGVLSDSSFEDPEPYLVVDIQSLPSQVPAPQLFQANNQTADNLGENGKDDSQEYLLGRVEEDEEEGEEMEPEEEVQSGWVITHTLDEIKNLYINLKGCKSAGYPCTFPVLTPKDGAQMEESKELVGDFLNFVLRDKTLSQSEHVYRFFNPSCEQLYLNTQSKKKGAEQIDDKNKDSIAIPFYTLLGEIFEIHGHLQWLRRQIIFLVRITFGSTIERQIYRAMGWAGSEQQVFWYIQCFKTAMWGDYPVSTELSDPVKREHLRGKVRMSLLNTPPHLLNVLFGTNKTRKGLAKILDTMEMRSHTKHCVYTVLELVLLHLIGTDPERNDRMKLNLRSTK